MYSGGMSIVIRSYGSWIAPSTSCRRTSGRDGGQLEALAAHLLDEDRQLELAATADLERLARLGRADLDRDVAEDLAVEPRLDLAAGDELALATGERRRVDAERHAQRRRVDVEARQRPRVGRIGERVADRDLGQAGDAHDVARAGLLDVHALDAVRGLEARHGPADRHGPARLDRTRRVVGLLADDGDPLTGPDRPVPDPPDRHPADVVVRREVRHEQLERDARACRSGGGVTSTSRSSSGRRSVPGIARSRVAVPALAFV